MTVVLRCAEYEPYHPDGVKKTRRPNWRRKPHPDYAVVLPLDSAKLAEGVRIPELTGVVIAGQLGESSTPKRGTRALSVFVVNRRSAGERGRRDVTLRLYYDARADTDDTSSIMHAKCVIIDDREVLITSANFTDRAQHDNIELGALIRDAEFAARVSGQWHTLVTRGLFRGYSGDVDAIP